MLLDEANMEKGDKPDIVLKKRDRGDDQYEDPSAGSNEGKKTKKRRFNESESSNKTSTTKESSKGKSPAKTSKSGKSVTTKEAVEDPVFEKASDDVEQTFNDNVDDPGQPPHTSAHEVLDPDWNTVKTVDDTLEQPWFNEVIPAEKPPLTFDDSMSTPIDFLAYAMNRLKLNEITLFGICNELEYNMEECYRYFTDQLDWANPEGHKSTVDMSKPLPLQDKEGNKERTYSSSITKTPAAPYNMEGIEDMIPKLWSPVIIAYDKDAALGISH
ncbi:hypothetical protein Tco_0404548 [Tanacetum coccineum]